MDHLELSDFFPDQTVAKLRESSLHFSKFVKNEEDPSLWLPTATLAAVSF